MSAGRPDTTRSSAPRSASDPASATTLSRMNHVRFADGHRPLSSGSSNTNSGTTTSAAAMAAVSAGWSCTRRSRRNQTIAVLGMGLPSRVIIAW